jgi:hypothetical protein
VGCETGLPYSIVDPEIDFLYNVHKYRIILNEGVHGSGLLFLPNMGKVRD